VGYFIFSREETFAVGQNPFMKRCPQYEFCGRRAREFHSRSEHILFKTVCDVGQMFQTTPVFRVEAEIKYLKEYGFKGGCSSVR
jgi:hypothetical protein